jgi:hypothetical protein
MSCTAAVDSYAAISEVVGEIRLSTISKRARIDDKRSEAMEKKKKKKTTRVL